MIEKLKTQQRFFVKQVFELGEIFAFETRNRYRISDERGQDIAYAAETQKGLLGFLLRQFLGHWRSFEIHFFSPDRQQLMLAKHPFRWFFQRLELHTFDGKMIGAIERRFSILTKKFDVHDAQGNIILQVASPIWRIWTFPFRINDRERARVSKKWSGVGYEMFTDKDNFLVEFLDPTLTLELRSLVLTAAVYIDLMFFENKGNR